MKKDAGEMGSTSGGRRDESLRHLRGRPDEPGGKGSWALYPTGTSGSQPLRGRLLTAGGSFHPASWGGTIHPASWGLAPHTAGERGVCPSRTGQTLLSFVRIPPPHPA